MTLWYSVDSIVLWSKSYTVIVKGVYQATLLAQRDSNFSRTMISFNSQVQKGSIIPYRVPPGVLCTSNIIFLLHSGTYNFGSFCKIIILILPSGAVLRWFAVPSFTRDRYTRFLSLSRTLGLPSTLQPIYMHYVLHTRLSPTTARNAVWTTTSYSACYAAIASVHNNYNII